MRYPHTCNAHLRSKVSQIPNYHFCLEVKSDGVATIYYLRRVAQRDKWFYVQQRSLLGYEHACPRYFIFCQVRQTTSRNIPQELTVGGRILCGSGNALRSDVEYICHVYTPNTVHKGKHKKPPL